MSRMVFIDDDPQDDWQSASGDNLSAVDADDATDGLGADDDSDADADDADEDGDDLGGDTEDEKW